MKSLTAVVKTPAPVRTNVTPVKSIVPAQLIQTLEDLTQRVAQLEQLTGEPRELTDFLTQKENQHEET